MHTSAIGGDVLNGICYSKQFSKACSKIPVAIGCDICDAVGAKLFGKPKSEPDQLTRHQDGLFVARIPV